MDKVGAITMPNMQLPMIAEMQQMVAMAGNRVEFDTALPEPAGVACSLREKKRIHLHFPRYLRGQLIAWITYNIWPAISRPQWIWASVMI